MKNEEFDFNIERKGLKSRAPSEKKEKPERVKKERDSGLFSQKEDSFDMDGEKKAFSLADIFKNKKSGIAIIIIAAILLVAIIACVVAFGFVIPKGNEIVSIKVDTLPKKMEYYVTDKADFRGLKVGVTRNNGEYFIVDGSDCKITGFDSSKPYVKQVITISYEGFTTNLYININEIPVVNPTLSEIKVTTLPKTEYKLGDRLNTTGGIITLYYSDGSQLLVNLQNSNVSKFASITEPGEYELTVKYTQDGVTCTTTYTITVTE